MEDESLIMYMRVFMYCALNPAFLFQISVPCCRRAELDVEKRNTGSSVTNEMWFDSVVKSCSDMWTEIRVEERCWIFIVCEKYCGSQATKARSKREYEDLSTGAAEEDVETKFNKNQDK